MPKYLIDSKFGETIKTARMQNNIPANKLAKHISKSPAYISKLERGEIKTIDIKVFESIISFIFGNNIDKNTIVNKIYDSLKIKYSDKEIEEALWFLNYSTVSCKIPIPKALIEHINTLLKDHNISSSYLLKRINSNESLSEKDKISPHIEDNLWYSNKNENGEHIRINISEQYLSSVLDGTRDRSAYIFILCILFYINKIIKYQDKADITNDEYNELINQSTDTLNNYKFYSIIEKNRLLSEAKNATEISEILNSFDNNNRKLISNIITNLHMFSELDVKQTNEYLEQYCKSLEWDIGFAIKILGLPYSKLNNISFSSKKGLISEIESLIDKYSDSSDERNKIEMY